MFGRIKSFVSLCLRGKSPPPPMILPIPRRHRSIDELENENCALRQKLRERSRMANEGFAAAAKAKHERDRAQADLAIAKQQLTKSDRAISRLEADVGRKKRANRAMAKICCEYRDALKALRKDLAAGMDELKDGLTLQALDGPIDILVPAIRCGVVVKDGRGVRAGIAVCSESRRLVGEIFARVLPAMFAGAGQTKATADP